MEDKFRGEAAVQGDLEGKVRKPARKSLYDVTEEDRGARKEDQLELRL